MNTENVENLRQFLNHEAGIKPHSSIARIRRAYRASVALILAQENCTNPEAISDRIPDILADHPEWALPDKAKIAILIEADSRVAGSNASRIRPEYLSEV